MPPFAAAARGLGFAWPGGARALADVSFSVAPGEIVALMGANGAGKSTLLRLFAGRLAPTEGKIEVAGRPAYLPQDAALDPEMTPGETLELIAALLRLPEREGRVARAVAAFGLLPHLHKPVAELSGGWRRRLDLAIFLLEEKELLLLDEPAAGLDAAGEEILFAELEKRAAAGAAVLIAGHDPLKLGRLTRRALLFEAGRIVAEGAPEQFAAAGVGGAAGGDTGASRPAHGPGSGRGGGGGRR